MACRKNFALFGSLSKILYHTSAVVSPPLGEVGSFVNGIIPMVSLRNFSSARMGPPVSRVIIPGTQLLFMTIQDLFLLLSVLISRQIVLELRACPTRSAHFE